MLLPSACKVVQCNGSEYKGVCSSAVSALGEEQPVTDQASLCAGSMKKVADIVHDGQQFVHSSLLCICHQKVQLHSDHKASLPDQFIQSELILLRDATPPHRK